MLLTNIRNVHQLAAGLTSNDPAVPGIDLISDIDTVSLTNGSSAGQVDGLYRTYAQTIVNGTPFVLNCNSLSYQGQPITAGHLVAFKIKNVSPFGSGTITPGGGTTPVFSAWPIPIEPQGMITVDNATNGGSSLTITNSTCNIQFTSSISAVAVAFTLEFRSA